MAFEQRPDQECRPAGMPGGDTPAWYTEVNDIPQPLPRT